MFAFTPKVRSLFTVFSATYFATLVGRGFPIIFISKSWSCKFQLTEVNLSVRVRLFENKIYTMANY